MDDAMLRPVRDLQRWTLPSHGLKIETIDAHCGGEPLRLVIGGFPAPPGRTMVERRRYAAAELDHLRKALILEPRGHAHQYGCLLTPPERGGSHFGTLFFDASGWGTLCGHGVIALATIVVEAGLVAMSGPETRIKLDTPAGLVRAFASVEDDRVRGVFFENVPAFVLALDVRIDVPGLGVVECDIAFGGVFYAFVSAASFGLAGTVGDAPALREKGIAIKRALEATRPFPHPLEPDLGFLGGVIFYDEPPRRRAATFTADTRHVCVFAEGEIDRSPAGAGVSARLAILHARGGIAPGDSIKVESLLGTHFGGKIVAETTFGPHAAVCTEIEATAFITGRNTLFIDPEDPLREGFVVGV